MVLVDCIACSSFTFALLLPSIDLANNGVRITQVLDNLRCPYRARSNLRTSSFCMLDFELKSLVGRLHSILCSLVDGGVVQALAVFGLVQALVHFRLFLDFVMLSTFLSGLASLVVFEL